MRSDAVARAAYAAWMHARLITTALLMALAQAVLALTKQVHGLTVGAYDASMVIGRRGDAP